MKRLTLILFSLFVVTTYTAAQTGEPRYLNDEEVTRLKTTPEWAVSTNLDPKIDGTTYIGPGFRVYVYCNDRIYVSGSGNGDVYWFDLKNETGLDEGTRKFAYNVGAANSLNVALDPRDNWGRGFTSTGKYLIQYRIRESFNSTETIRQDLYPITEFLVVQPNLDPNHVEGKGGTLKKRIILTEAQYNLLAETVGAPTDISSWGDIMGPTGGYIVFVGVKTKPTYTVIKKIVKIEIANGEIKPDGIKFYDAPELNPGVRQIFLRGLSKDHAIVNFRSSHIGIYDFSMNNGAGGWSPEFQISSGYETSETDPMYNPEVGEGRGFNLGTTGFCAFQMKGPKATKPRNIFLFPTGFPNYTEKFTGYDIDNYRWIETENRPDYSDCYYYAPGVAPSGDQICCKNIFNNFLYFRQDPNNQSLGYVYQVRPSTNNVGNMLRCYKIEILPREEVFLQPEAGMTEKTKIVKSSDGKHVIGLNGKAIFNNAPSPSANNHKELANQLTISDYRVSLFEHNGAGYNVEPLESQVSATNNYIFKDLKQPDLGATANYEYDVNSAAKGKYKVTGYVHYRWYGQVSFKSPEFTGYIQPNYESASAVPAKYKSVWVKDSPFPGGVTKSSIFVAIDFDKANTKTPVSCYRVWAIKDAGEPTEERIQVGEDIPGDFDFVNGKDEIANYQFTKGPDGEKIYVPEEQKDHTKFVCYFNIPDVSESQKETVVSQYHYEVETIFGIGKPKVERVYKTYPEPVSEGVVTGVEIIGENNMLSISPTLVDDVISISGAENINNVEVFSLSGTLVRHIQGINNDFVSLNLEDLASGTYFIKVNNYNVVRIIKK